MTRENLLSNRKSWDKQNAGETKYKTMSCYRTRNIELTNKSFQNMSKSLRVRITVTKKIDHNEISYDYAENDCHHSVQGFLPSLCPPEILKFKLYRSMNTASHLWDCATKEMCPGLMIEGVNEQWRKLRNGELLNLHSSAFRGLLVLSALVQFFL